MHYHNDGSTHPLLSTGRMKVWFICEQIMTGTRFNMTQTTSKCFLLWTLNENLQTVVCLRGCDNKWNVQKVLTRHIIVNISIIMPLHYDILLSELIWITVWNEPGPQECAAFVLGSCQVPTSVLGAKLLLKIKSSDTQRGLSGHMRRKHKMPLKGVWIEWSERTQPISFSWIRAFKPTLYYNQPSIQPGAR